MLTTCLWSPTNQALEMAEFYCSVFPDSQITSITRYDEPNPHIAGSQTGDPLLVEFTLLGESRFSTLYGGPYFQHSCAVSFMIPCASQVELEHFYDQLSSVPEAEQCGWVTDRFGVSWQLIPANFTEYMKNGEPEKKAGLMKALMEMRRLSWEGIEQAYNS